jgi:hypothetical protein
MYFLLPLIKDLPLETSFSCRNPKFFFNSDKVGIVIELWSNFNLTGSKAFNDLTDLALHFNLADIFGNELIQNASVAKVFFVNIPPPIGRNFLFEMQLNLSWKNKKSIASVLYDMVFEKGKEHQYFPITHCAHASYKSEAISTYILIANYRPVFLKPNSIIQKLILTCNDNEGKLLGKKTLNYFFNDTNLISFDDEFYNFGGVSPGYQISIKGGESQFIIFTLFINKLTGAIGIEHSLPPIYYCSSIYKPENRSKFFKSAFK